MGSPNTHNNIIKQLKTNIYSSSDFLRYNRKVRNIADLNKYLKISSHKFSYPNPNNPTRKSIGHVKQINITLPNIRDNDSKIYIFSTAEHNAITIGKIAIQKNKKINFILPRFHTGIPAQLDLKIAVGQCLEFKKLVREFPAKKDIDKKTYGVYFIREGYLTDLQNTLYNKLKTTIPFTLAHVEHIKKNRGKLKRSVKICDINFEGLEPKSVNTLIFCGNIASGIQQIAVTEYTLKKINKNPRLNSRGLFVPPCAPPKGGDIDTASSTPSQAWSSLSWNKITEKNKIKKIVIFSPLLTLIGALTISRWAASKKINVVFVASAALLNTDDNFYYSPLANNPLTCVNPKLVQLHEWAHDSASKSKACVRCNWTASFLNPMQALIDSKEELQKYKSSNKLLLNHCKKIKLKDLKKRGINPMDLIPYSDIGKPAY